MDSLPVVAPRHPPTASYIVASSYAYLLRDPGRAAALRPLGEASPLRPHRRFHRRLLAALRQGPPQNPSVKERPRFHPLAYRQANLGFLLGSDVPGQGGARAPAARPCA